MRYRKKEEKNENMYVVDFAFKKLSKSTEKQFNLLFTKIEDYKNDFVNFINNRIDEIKKEDEEIKKIQDEIDLLHNTEGKVAKQEEKSDRLRELYKEKGKKIAPYYFDENGKLNKYQLVKDFNAQASIEYNIYLHDDAKSYACQNVISSLEKWMKGEGKNIHTHKYGTTNAITSRRNINDEGKTRSTMIQFVFEGETLYVRMWDLNDEYIEKQKKNLKENKGLAYHKCKLIRLNVNRKDEYQNLIFKAPRYGNAKLVRIWKHNRYFYRVQISLKGISPIIGRYTHPHHRVGIDCGTETNAVVRDDGLMYIEEVSPDTPRCVEAIILKQQKRDNSIKILNPERYKENGVPYSKKEAKNLNLPNYVFSNNATKLRKEIKTMYAVNSRRRKKNNEKSAKNILELGDRFYIESNNFVAWKMKMCRMSKKAKAKYDNGIRKSDYPKQAQDRATAQIPARIKSVCTQKGLEYNVVKGLNLSTYNHFTKQNDIFTSLKDRIITLDEKCIDEENGIVSFDNTFSSIEYNGKKYILQRDLYAASKMIYCYSKMKKEKYTDKDGNEKTKLVEHWYFDQEGYEKFFDEIFYPAQEAYIKQLIEDKKLGKHINGTILGY